MRHHQPDEWMVITFRLPVKLDVAQTPIDHHSRNARSSAEVATHSTPALSRTDHPRRHRALAVRLSENPGHGVRWYRLRYATMRPKRVSLEPIAAIHSNIDHK